jgi:ABC-2 type transport system permease protein
VSAALRPGDRPAGDRPVPLGRAIAAQTRTEIVLAARRGESVLLTMVIPLVLLVFFAAVPLLPIGRHPIATLFPGVVALSVLSTAMVGLAIATGFERQQGVLKLLGVSPLPRGGWLAAKVVSVLAIEVVQLVVLGAAALALGWRPGERALLVVPLLLLGTAAFAGLGLLMAGRLRAETTLAAANGLYVLLLLGGGLVLPLSSLPGPIGDVARLLPADALAETLRATLGPAAPFPAEALVVLIVWAVLAPVAAALAFRWQEER